MICSALRSSLSVEGAGCTESTLISTIPFLFVQIGFSLSTLFMCSTPFQNQNQLPI